MAFRIFCNPDFASFLPRSAALMWCSSTCAHLYIFICYGGKRDPGCCCVFIPTFLNRNRRLNKFRSERLAYTQDARAIIYELFFCKTRNFHPDARAGTISSSRVGGALLASPLLLAYCWRWEKKPPPLLPQKKWRSARSVCARHLNKKEHSMRLLISCKLAGLANGERLVSISKRRWTI